MSHIVKATMCLSLAVEESEAMNMNIRAMTAKNFKHSLLNGKPQHCFTRDQVRLWKEYQKKNSKKNPFIIKSKPQEKKTRKFKIRNPKKMVKNSKIKQSKKEQQKGLKDLMDIGGKVVKVAPSFAGVYKQEMKKQEDFLKKSVGQYVNHVLPRKLKIKMKKSKKPKSGKKAQIKRQNTQKFQRKMSMIIRDKSSEEQLEDMKEELSNIKRKFNYRLAHVNTRQPVELRQKENTKIWLAGNHAKECDGNCSHDNCLVKHHRHLGNN